MSGPMCKIIERRYLRGYPNFSFDTLGRHRQFAASIDYGNAIRALEQDFDLRHKSFMLAFAGDLPFDEYWRSVMTQNLNAQYCHDDRRQ